MNIGLYILAGTLGFWVPVLIYYKFFYQTPKLPTLNEMIAEDCKKFREEINK